VTCLVEADESASAVPHRSAIPRWRSARWYEFLPEVLLVGGLGLFAATEPHAALSAFGSSTALLLMAGVVVAWITVRMIFFVAGGWPVIRSVVFTGAALAILRVVVLPAYQDHTIVEDRPEFAAQVSASARGPLTSDLPVSHATSPVIVSTGAVHGVNHRASGTATVYRQPDGRFVVGLEDFDIQPGPAYALYVVRGADRRDHRDGTRIDALRGNKGTQYYDIPQGVAVADGQWTVLVWCEIFDVPVANATPETSTPRIFPPSETTGQAGAP
jgi:hypothetical protein